MDTHPPAPEATDRPADDASSVGAWRLLVSAVRFGESLGSGIVSRLGDPELAQNTPIAVIADLALHGTRRPVEITEFTGLTNSGVTRMLERLETAGLVSRSFGQVPGDRRAIVVALTAEGERVADLIAQALQDEIDLLRGMLAEMSTLLEAIEVRDGS
jgi:DNA-binding MarR family transcriptional regulator